MAALTEPLETTQPGWAEVQARFASAKESLPGAVRYVLQTERKWLYLLLPGLALMGCVYYLVWNSWFNFYQALAFQAFVPLGVAWGVWAWRDQIAETDEELSILYSPDSPHRRGNLWPAGLGCLIILLSEFSMLTTLAVLGLVVTIVGIVYYLYGAAILRVIWIPLFFLLLMVPPPAQYLGTLMEHLDVGSAHVLGQALQPIYHNIFVHGATLKMPSYQMEINGPCSGLNILFPVVAIALFYALNRQAAVGLSAILLAAALIIALLVNLARLFLIGLISGMNPELAAEMQDSNPILFTCLATYLTFLLSRVLLRQRRRVSEFEADLWESVQDLSIHPDAVAPASISVTPIRDSEESKDGKDGEDGEADAMHSDRSDRFDSEDAE